MRALTACLFLLSVSILGCQSLKEKLAAQRDAGADSAEAGAGASGSNLSANGEYQPCVLLADDSVKKAFPELANVQFEDQQTLADLNRAMKGEAPKKRSDYRRETLLGSICTYSWPKPDAAAIRARNQAKSEEMVKKTLAGAKGKGGLAGGLLAGLSDMESENANVSLAISGKKPASSPAAARQAYDAKITALRNGVKGKDIDATGMIPEGANKEAVQKAVASIETKPDDTLVEIKGIGDAAMWSARSRTLHVLSGPHLFNLTVDAGDAINREKAEALAQVVVKNL